MFDVRACKKIIAACHCLSLLVIQTRTGHEGPAGSGKVMLGPVIQYHSMPCGQQPPDRTNGRLGVVHLQGESYLLVTKILNLSCGRLTPNRPLGGSRVVRLLGLKSEGNAGPRDTLHLGLHGPRTP
jgi:hypothetical protein